MRKGEQESFTKRAAPWTLWLSLLLSAAPAFSQEPAVSPRLRLSWVRDDEAAGCPDARSVEEAVRARLGRDPFSTDAELAAEVLITRESAAHMARIRLRDAAGNLRGERTLRSEESCSTLASAVALALALFIDPDAALAAPVAPAEAPAQAALPAARSSATMLTAPAPMAPTPPRESAAPPAQQRPTAALSAGMVGAHGLLPGLSLGAALEAELTVGERVHPHLTGLFFPEQDVEGGNFAFGLTVGGLGACVDGLASQRMALAACVDLSAGELHSVVRTLEPLRPGARFWMAASALVRLRMMLFHRLFAELGAGAWVPLWRDAFRLSGGGRTVFRQSAVAPLGQLSLGTTIW